MLLAVDAGNTQTVFGLFRMVSSGSTGASPPSGTARATSSAFSSGLLDLDSVDGICLSSTVPPLVQSYEDFGERWAHAPVLS